MLVIDHAHRLAEHNQALLAVLLRAREMTGAPWVRLSQWLSIYPAIAQLQQLSMS